MQHKPSVYTFNNAWAPYFSTPTVTLIQGQASELLLYTYFSSTSFLTISKDNILPYSHTHIYTHTPITDLHPEKQDPLAAPKVESATAKGMMKDAGPRIWEPHVCNKIKHLPAVNKILSLALV